MKCVDKIVMGMCKDSEFYVEKEKHESHPNRKIAQSAFDKVKWERKIANFRFVL